MRWALAKGFNKMFARLLLHQKKRPGNDRRIFHAVAKYHGHDRTGGKRVNRKWKISTIR